MSKANPKDAAPPRATISMQRLMQAAQEIETPRYMQRWSLMIAALGASSSLILAVTVATMLPLREYVPYFVVERAATGQVEMTPDIGREFIVSNANLIYFATRFLRRLYTIDELTQRNLPDSFESTRGAAMQQWRSFVGEVDRPLARMVEDPTLRRSIRLDGTPQIISVRPGAPSGTMVFFVTEITVSQRGGTSQRRLRITLDYMVSAPDSLEQAQRNPIGFFVTSFNQEVI